jgi:hypothetical protein
MLQRWRVPPAATHRYAESPVRVGLMADIV